MTREIKFRVYNQKEKRMYFPRLQDSFPYEDMKIMDLEVMQYTGLKDTNGKEIFEGDLLKYLSHYPTDFQERNPYKKHLRICGPVVWEDGWLYADKKENKGNGIEDMLLYKKSAEEFEIIGNIYENPKLLK